ncbi:hypothetical protein B0I00_2878 [Novosphingobium kunmingense]|uniref:Terminase small subunit n=1 Tax=Novosphingobium kunmingense TaxID=1211806 RepID=A0A2N0H5P6_9SPHN|nr:hypothetical protein [Novosphingobium kunmingense]PKB14246.1 hypothetical protein B0I00_2878 [Novosphingobium kunmingense]
MADRSKTRARTAAPAKKRTFKQWSPVFLAELAITSNVSAAARKAGVHSAQAYEARRLHPEFNRAWQQALCEGYDYLEMELLSRLRSGEVKPATGAKRGVRAFDNATAFRLLSAHRESAARFRAVRHNQDAEAIVQSINAKLDAMRQRHLAALADGTAAHAAATVIDGDQ